MRTILTGNTARQQQGFKLAIRGGGVFRSIMNTE